jgi:ABC-2 type transport system ATP-binding protein
MSRSSTASSRADASAGIVVRELTKTYSSGLEVLGGVTFTVRPGTIFGYLGRNGAGKSTTVRILSTLTRPTSGLAQIPRPPAPIQ